MMLSNVVYRSQPPPPVVTAVLELAPAPRARPAASGLEALIWSRVIPELAARRGIEGTGTHPRAAELAGLLLEAAPGPVKALLEQAVGEIGSLAPLRMSLLEPAARLLGDKWLDDSCTEAEIILGLSVLQSAMRRLVGVRSRCLGDFPGRAVVTLLPGETHMLGVVLAADALRDAGWDVVVAFPADVDALSAQLRSERPDLLHLALSDVFRREEALPLLRRVVQMARSSCADRPLRITVGGRVCAERRFWPGSVGADGLLPG